MKHEESDSDLGSGFVVVQQYFCLTDRAICHDGECDFLMGNLYEHAIINCQWTIKEDVFVWLTFFEIVATGEECIVLESW